MKVKSVRKIAGSLSVACGLACLVTAVMALSVPNVAQAEAAPQSSDTCGPDSLQGLYVFNAHGFNIIGGVAQPKAIVEGIEFSGDGTLVSPFATVSINGTIVRSTNAAGTYTVAADCTGTLSFTGAASFDIFVGPRAKQIWMIQTGPEAVPAAMEGTATKVSR